MQLPQSFRGRQERTPYDEIRYLKSLQKSRSPPFAAIPCPANYPNHLNSFRQNY
jgi:hypothetical protein